MLRRRRDRRSSGGLQYHLKCHRIRIGVGVQGPVRIFPPSPTPPSRTSAVECLELVAIHIHHSIKRSSMHGIALIGHHHRQFLVMPDEDFLPFLPHVFVCLILCTRCTAPILHDSATILMKLSLSLVADMPCCRFQNLPVRLR